MILGFCECQGWRATALPTEPSHFIPVWSPPLIFPQHQNLLSTWPPSAADFEVFLTIHWSRRMPFSIEWMIPSVACTKHTKAIKRHHSLLRSHKWEALSSRHAGDPVVARTLNVQREWEYSVLQTHHQMMAFLNQGVCDQLLLYFLISPPSLCVCMYICKHACVFVHVSGVHVCHSVHVEVGGNLGYWSFAFSLFKTRSLCCSPLGMPG